MKKGKRKIKCIVCFLISLIVFMGILLLINVNQDDKGAKGSITIWADESSYDYLNSVAQDFMIENYKAKINVIKISNNEYLDKVSESVDSGDLPNVVNLNRGELQELLDKDGEKISIKENDDFIKRYSSNFTNRMIQEATIDDKIVAIPFTTNPIVLYLREDILSHYGYNYEDINNWEELIKMGKDIYSKSEGKIRILNATGEDYQYLVSLLIMQEMEGTNDEKLIIKNVKDRLTLLKNENILNFDKDGSYLARIASIEAMEELKGVQQKCSWTANNPPSKGNGSNRFYTVASNNLVIINKDSNNENLLVEKYIAAITTNTKRIYNPTNNNNIFLSYLSVYKNKDIESQANNFIDRSPLVVMANIMQKAPELTDYQTFIKANKELTNQ